MLFLLLVIVVRSRYDRDIQWRLCTQTSWVAHEVRTEAEGLMNHICSPYLGKREWCCMVAAPKRRSFYIIYGNARLNQGVARAYNASGGQTNQWIDKKAGLEKNRWNNRICEINHTKTYRHGSWHTIECQTCNQVGYLYWGRDTTINLSGSWCIEDSSIINSMSN